MKVSPSPVRALRIRGVHLLVGFSSLLLPLPGYAATPPLPPDPGIVPTLEKETYVRFESTEDARKPAGKGDPEKPAKKPVAKGDAAKPAKKPSEKGDTAESARPTKLFEGEGIAKLIALGDGKLGLLTGLISGDDKSLEYRTGEGGEGLKFGWPVEIELPEGKGEFHALECVADSKGTAHVFLVEDVGANVTDGVVHYLQISPEGKIVLPWLSLTAKLGLERQPYPPAVLPLRDGKLLFQTTGSTGKDGWLVTAEATSGRVRLLSRQPLPPSRFSFGLEGSHGRVVATGPKDVWLVDCGMDRRSWVHLQTGKKTLWFAAQGGEDSWIEEDDWTVATAGGLAYAAARTGKGEGRGTVSAKLVLACAKPGASAKLVEIPGRFQGETPCSLVATSKGGMYLLTVTGSEADGESPETLELWEVSAAKPRKVAAACEGTFFAGLSAALGRDDAIHVVFNDGDAWYGATLSTRKR